MRITLCLKPKKVDNNRKTILVLLKRTYVHEIPTPISIPIEHARNTSTVRLYFFLNQILNHCDGISKQNLEFVFFSKPNFSFNMFFICTQSFTYSSVSVPVSFLSFFFCGKFSSFSSCIKGIYWDLQVPSCLKV